LGGLSMEKYWLLSIFIVANIAALVIVHYRLKRNYLRKLSLVDNENKKREGHIQSEVIFSIARALVPNGLLGELLKQAGKANQVSRTLTGNLTVTASGPESHHFVGNYFLPDGTRLHIRFKEVAPEE